MDTTPEADDRISQVRTLLDQVHDVDPAAAIQPLSEIADILERLLDGDEA